MPSVSNQGGGSTFLTSQLALPDPTPPQRPHRFIRQRSPPLHLPLSSLVMSLHSPLPVLHPVCSMRGPPAVVAGSSAVADGGHSIPPPGLPPSISPSPSSTSTHTVHASPPSSYGSSSSGSSSSAVTPGSVVGSGHHPTPPFLGHLCSPARPSPPTTSHLTASRSQQSIQTTICSDPMVISPPRTPTPGASGRKGEERMGGQRDEVDREGVHGGLDGHGVDGIEYSKGCVDNLQVLDRVGQTTIRAITADEVSP